MLPPRKTDQVCSSSTAVDKANFLKVSVIVETNIVFNPYHVGHLKIYFPDKYSSVKISDFLVSIFLLFCTVFNDLHIQIYCLPSFLLEYSFLEN